MQGLAVSVVAVVVVVAVLAALWFVVFRGGRKFGFRDYTNTARLTNFHSLSSVPSQKFDYEWELLKQQANLDNLVVDFRRVDVDEVSFASRPAPTVEFAARRGVTPEVYKGALTSDALLRFLHERLKC